MNAKPKILVVDDEESIRESVCFLVESEFGAETFRAKSVADAMNLLGSHDFAAIISDYDMPGACGGTLFTRLQSQSKCPPFILISGSRPEEHLEFNSGKLFGYAEKPHRMIGELREILFRLFKKSESEFSEQYIKIRTPLLRQVHILPCDVFIKLSDKKYIKVLAAGDVFSAGEQIHFDGKGLEYLYIETKNSREILNKITHELFALSQQAIAKNSSHDQFWISDALQETVRELATCSDAFSPELEQIVKTNMNMTLAIAKQNPSLDKLIKKLAAESKNFYSAHSVLLPYVCCQIAEYMGWNSEQTFQKLTLASLFHDSCLKDINLAKIMDASELNQKSPELQADWRLHMVKAADLVRQFREIPPDVDQIILQHHEKPDGTGYPHKMHDSRIAPLAALFIVAHHFVHYLVKTGRADLKEFARKHAAQYSRGHFKKIIDSILNSNSAAKAA